MGHLVMILERGERKLELGLMEVVMLEQVMEKW